MHHRRYCQMHSDNEREHNRYGRLHRSDDDHADGHAHQPGTQDQLAAPVPEAQPDRQHHPDLDLVAVLGRDARPVSHAPGDTLVSVLKTGRRS